MADESVFKIMVSGVKAALTGIIDTNVNLTMGVKEKSIDTPCHYRPTSGQHECLQKIK